MKATVHYHQVICSETGKSCGENGEYCEKCLFKNPPQYSYTTSDGWQCCPICNGLGMVYNSGLSSSTYVQCTVCNGKKIISTANGLPPSP